MTTPTPTNPFAREDVLALDARARQELEARVRALTAAGKYDAAVALARAQAPTEISHPATEAELQLALGRLDAADLGLARRLGARAADRAARRRACPSCSPGDRR